MKPLLLVLLPLLLLFAACKEEEDTTVKIPPHVLNKQQFAKLLMDFAMAESAGGMNIRNVPAQQIDSIYAFDPLKENHITRAQYDSTLAFYTLHTDLYQEVYQDVLTGLSALQTHRDSLKTRDDAKHKSDSLAAAAKASHADSVKKAHKLPNKPHNKPHRHIEK